MPRARENGVFKNDDNIGFEEIFRKQNQENCQDLVID